MFDEFDQNGNGFLSFNEVYTNIKKVLSCENLFEAKPAVMRAFQHAKDYCPSKGRKSKGDDYVERKEFRVFLVALRQRFEYLQAFQRIDKDNNGKIELDEFLRARANIEMWVGPIEDMEAEFRAIDENGGG